MGWNGRNDAKASNQVAASTGTSIGGAPQPRGPPRTLVLIFMTSSLVGTDRSIGDDDGDAAAAARAAAQLGLDLHDELLGWMDWKG